MIHPTQTNFLTFYYDRATQNTTTYACKGPRPPESGTAVEGVSVCEVLAHHEPDKREREVRDGDQGVHNHVHAAHQCDDEAEPGGGEAAKEVTDIVAAGAVPDLAQLLMEDGVDEMHERIHKEDNTYFTTRLIVASVLD